MKRVTIVRCPRCGSTHAGEDASRSAYDLTYMQCGHCGHGELVDEWQVKSDWNARIELADDATSLPAFIRPEG